MNCEGHSGLVVEDDPELTIELRELFAALGYGFIHASTYDEAMPLIEKGGFCFGLLDLQIKKNADSIRPRVETGMTLFEQVRKRYPRRNEDDKLILQLVAMSGHAKDRLDAIRLMQLGANDFHVKPFVDNEEPLAAVIRRCLRKSGRNDHAECARLNELAAGLGSVRPPPAAKVSDAPVALLFSNERRGEPLTADALKALVDARKEYDLFLNFVVPGAEGYVAGRKDAKGKFHEAALTQTGAALIAELVREQRPLCAARMKCVRHGGIGEPVRAIERARRAVDERIGRTSWRAIQTISHVGGDDTTKEFVFAPPADLRFAVVVKAVSVGE